MNGLLGLVLLLALGGLVYWLVLVAWTIRSLQRPPRQTYASAVAKGRAGDPGELDGSREFAAWTLQSQGRKLAVWDIVGEVEHGPVAIVTHGWGSGKVNALVRVPLLASLCSRVILWDLPGHGDSGGVCTLGVRERLDVLNLIERVGFDRPIVLCGSSMGAGVNIAAASRCEGVALVLAEAPYRLAPTPARNVMRLRKAPTAINLKPALAWIGLRTTGRWTGPSLDTADEAFDRSALAAKLRRPLVVMHGDVDATCPLEDGKAIAAACPHRKFVEISRGTHHNLWKEPACRATMEDAYIDAIRGLINA